MTEHLICDAIALLSGDGRIGRYRCSYRVWAGLKFGRRPGINSGYRAQEIARLGASPSVEREFGVRTSKRIRYVHAIMTRLWWVCHAFGQQNSFAWNLWANLKLQIAILGRVDLELSRHPLGADRSACKSPTDLLANQVLVCRVRSVVCSSSA